MTKIAYLALALIPVATLASCSGDTGATKLLSAYNQIAQACTAAQRQLEADLQQLGNSRLDTVFYNGSSEIYNDGNVTGVGKVTLTGSRSKLLPDDGLPRNELLSQIHFTLSINDDNESISVHVTAATGRHADRLIHVFRQLSEAHNWTIEGIPASE